ncbi:hypothetical protein LCGC14_3096870, partial [marine sediment metagenome]
IGRIVLSDRLLRVSSALGLVQKFIRTNASATDEWWGLVSGSKMLNTGTTSITTTWAADDTTGFAGVDTPLDMKIHESVNGEQRLFVTMNDDIAVLNTTATVNTWDVNWGSTIPSTPIPVVSPVLAHRPIARLQRLLAIANKVSGIPKIDTIDKDDVVSLGRLTFDVEFTVRLTITTSNRFWFALQHDTDGDAKIIEWDGFSLTYNNEYNLSGSFPLTGFVVRDIPYFITEKGIIFKYNGGGFEEVQNFNLEEERFIFATGIDSEATIKAHGSFVEGDIVYLNVGIPLISTTTDADKLTLGARKARSGIWIYNTKTGNLYHHMGIGQYASAGTDVDYGHGYLDQVGT